MCKLFGLFLLSLLSSLVSAAELVVPEQFDLLRINGEESTTYFQRTKNVPLALGHNEIEMEFNQIHDAEFGDSHDRIRSKPFTVVIDVSTENEQWTIQAPQPKSRREALAYAKAPVYTLHNAGGESKTVTVEAAKKHQVVKPLPSANPIHADKPMVTTPPTVDVLQMLNYWWQMATPEQRAAFLQSVDEK